MVMVAVIMNNDFVNKTFQMHAGNVYAEHAIQIEFMTGSVQLLYPLVEHAVA